MLPKRARDESRCALIQELRRGKPICLCTQTCSMTPSILPGDVLTVRSVDSNDLLQGDILLIESEDEWIIHRLLALRPLNEEIYAITRGDNADNIDQPVPIKRILGKVTEIRRDNCNVPLAPMPAYNNVDKILLLSSFPSVENPPRPSAFARASADKSGTPPVEGIPTPLVPLLGGDSGVGRSPPWRGSAPRRSASGHLAERPTWKRGVGGWAHWSQGDTPIPDLTWGMDVETFLSAADRECLSPLIYFSHYRHMKSDSSIVSHLEKAYFTTLARNTVFLEELKEVSQALQGIEFIILKGAYLALRVYTSPGARQFSDIDILIKLKDFKEVHSRLTRIGYITPSPFPLPRGERTKVSGSPSGAPLISTYLNSIVYHNVKKNIPLHIHWHLLNSTLPLYASVNMDIDEIWKSARKTCAFFMELCPEHLIIHLSEHALRHSFDRLILLRDVAEVLCKFSGEINWDRLITDSRKFKLSRAVYYTLLLAARKTGAYVPGSAFEALSPKRPGLGEKLFLKLITRGMRHPELCSLVYISNSSSFRGKVSLAWRMAFPPRSVLAQAYNRLPHEIGLTIYIKRLLRGFRNALFATGHFLINSRTPRVMAKRRQTMLNPRNDLASKP